MTTDAPRHPELPNLYLIAALGGHDIGPEGVTATVRLAIYYDPEHFTPPDLAAALRDYASALDPPPPHPHA